MSVIEIKEVFANIEWRFLTGAIIATFGMVTLMAASINMISDVDEPTDAQWTFVIFCGGPVLWAMALVLMMIAITRNIYIGGKQTLRRKSSDR